MYQLLLKMHPTLTVLLLALYALLAWRWWTLQQPRPSVWYRTLAHISRFFLLLLYLNGFMLYAGYRFPVGDWHHYASLLPVSVIFFFQFIPALAKKPLSARKQSIMWMAMFLCIFLISVLSRY
jgi:hypothetical protein